MTARCNSNWHVAAVPYFIVGIVLIPLVMYLTVKWQRDSDRKRTAYRLILPSDLSTEQVVEWLSAISGSMRSQGTRPSRVSS